MSIITIKFNYDTLEAEKLVKQQGEDPRHVVVDPPVMAQTLLDWFKDSVDEYWFPGITVESSDYSEN